MLTKIILTGTSKSVIRRNFLNYNYIAGPVQFKPLHWCLFIAAINTHQIIYIDPLGTTGDDIDTVMVNWKGFCKNRTLKEINWTNLKLKYFQ